MCVSIGIIGLRSRNLAIDHRASSYLYDASARKLGIQEVWYPSPSREERLQCRQRRDSPSPGLFDERIERDATIWIARGAECNPRRYLVLPLDGLALRRSHIR